MKIAIQTLILCLMFAVGFTACGGNEKAKSSGDKTEQVDKTGKEYTSKYICPMHCEGSGSDSPGDCPVCGMAYVENTGSNNHDHHNHDHHGHDHNHDH